jgi:hypothetical protein
LPGFLVVQQREYRKHQIELVDRGKAGCAVIVRPPRSMGQVWEVPRDGAAVTLVERLNQAKVRIDAVMGPRPGPRFQPAAGRGR